ncbi:MAG: hypothetical protein GX778_00435 [Erysipelothrix sp.]|nr:hypothetical protein [Erysipelothrix sp.]
MSKVVYLNEHPSDGVMSFLGLDVIELNKRTDFKHLVRQLLHERVSIAYVSEKCYEWFEEEIESYNAEFSISFIVLPNDVDHEHFGQRRLSKIVEDAVGIKVE